MKYFTEFLVFLLMVTGRRGNSTVIADTNEDLDETTNGSGGGVDPTDESPGCPDNYCNGNGDCTPETTDENFTCTCYAGYSGDTCDIRLFEECQPSTEIIYNGDVHQGYNCSAYSDNDNSTITAHFEKTSVGDTAFSTETCDNACDGKNRSIAMRKCGTNGWEEVQYRVCGETDDLSNALEDFDPDTASDDEVKDAIGVIENATTQETITPEDADTILAVTNSLLLSTSSNASNEIKANSTKILDSMDNLANNVVLEDTGDGYYSYSDMESNVAFAVVANQTRSSKAYEDNTYYYGTDSEWDETLNLAVSEVTLTIKAPGGSYISAKLASPGQRISFKFYSDKQETMFEKIAESVTPGIVLSASGNVEEHVEYTFNFEINDTELTNKQIMCVKWKRESNVWNEETTCGSYNVSGTFASCVCREDGEYTMKKAIGEIDNGDLSPEAIAGISVGVTVAIVLIVVMICCCCKKKKKEEEDKNCGLFCCSAICCCFCKKSKVEHKDDETEMK